MGNITWKEEKRRALGNLKFQSALALTDIRLRFGLSQTKLAQRTGIHQPSIARAEQHGCSLGFLQKVCDALDVVVEIRLKNEPERTRGTPRPKKPHPTSI